MNTIGRRRPHRKARCRHYRNKKICGRVAKHIVHFFDDNGYEATIPVCRECKDAILESVDGAEVLESNSRGFTKSEDVSGGQVDREYAPI